MIQSEPVRSSRTINTPMASAITLLTFYWSPVSGFADPERT